MIKKALSKFATREREEIFFNATKTYNNFLLLPPSGPRPLTRINVHRIKRVGC
jgi:hypothetical protein